MGGDFRMDVCVYLIWYYHIKLPWVEVQKIIKRYKEHVAFWDFGMDIIRNDLRRFAETVCYPYNIVVKEFDVMDLKKEP